MLRAELAKPNVDGEHIRQLCSAIITPAIADDSNASEDESQSLKREIPSDCRAQVWKVSGYCGFLSFSLIY